MPSVIGSLVEFRYMDGIENGLSILTTQVIDKRCNGMTFEEIASEMEISVDDVVNAWRTYVASRAEMSPEEQWVLHLLRLEKLLVKANNRLNHASAAEDYEVTLKLLDRIEQLQALNKARKSEADDALLKLTTQQTQLILTAMFSMQNNVRQMLEDAFENGKTIKAIKGEVLEKFDPLYINAAQRALTGVSA